MCFPGGVAVLALVVCLFLFFLLATAPSASFA